MGGSSQLTREFSREREKIRKSAYFQANFFKPFSAPRAVQISSLEALESSWRALSNDSKLDIKRFHGAENGAVILDKISWKINDFFKKIGRPKMCAWLYMLNVLETIKNNENYLKPKTLFNSAPLQQIQTPCTAKKHIFCYFSYLKFWYLI